MTTTPIPSPPPPKPIARFSELAEHGSADAVAGAAIAADTSRAISELVSAAEKVATTAKARPHLVEAIAALVLVTDHT